MGRVTADGRVGTGWGSRALLAVALALALVVAPLLPDRAHAAGPAVSLAVSVPAATTAGSAFSITVTARDAAGAVATSYRGRVRFTSTDTRSPVLPARYTFTAADRGRRTFTGVRLFSAGPRTIAAFDTVRATVKGRSRAVAVVPAATSRLAVTAPTRATAGVPFAVTVTAKDPYLNVTPAYRGTVTFSTINPDTFRPTDPFTVLPAPYTFTAQDAGAHTFPGVMLPTGGPRVISGIGRPVFVFGSSARIEVAPRYAAYGLGRSDLGQLGDGFPTEPTTPRFMLPDTRWRTLSAGGSHTAGIKTDGTLWAWGLGENGQLGDGTAASGLFRSEARRVGTRADWASVHAGGRSTFAIKRNGTLWAWGANAQGQLGDGTTTDRWRPVEIGAGRPWSSVSTGNGFTLAVARDGTLWGWGLNGEGQLGLGTRTAHLAPVRVGAAADWASVSAGNTHALAIRRDGSLWAWGDNLQGSLGTGGDRGVVDRPVAVAAGTTWRSVAAGGHRSFGIRTDGALWAWGDNFGGELGDGTRIDRAIPGPTLTGRTWSTVVTSPGAPAQIAAISSDGVLWTWGSAPIPGPVPSPQPVGPSTSWRGVTVGAHHVMGISATMLPCRLC